MSTISRIGGGAQCSTVQAYPPAALTASLTNLTGQTYANGIYIATISSDRAGNPPTTVFDKNLTNFWQWTIPSTSYTYDINNNSYNGEWVQIQLPFPIILSYYALTAINANNPTGWAVLGSKDGNSWNLIDQKSNTSVINTTINFNVTTNLAFTYYRYVYITCTGAYPALTEWVLYGTEASLTVGADGQLGVGITNPVQSLEVAGNAIINGSISAGNLGMFRNRIINGDMRINQRGIQGTTINVTTTGTGVQQFGVDRFLYEANFSAGNMAITQIGLQTNDTPIQYGLQNYMRAQIQGQFTYTYNTALVQKIEGYNIQDFNWGTVNAVPITLSFWLRTNIPAGSVFNTAIRRGDIGYSYNLTTITNSPNTWQYVTATIPVPPNTSANWATVNGLNGLGMYISFGAISAATGASGNTTTPNTWQQGNYFGSTSAYNFYSVLNAAIDITGVQLEKGTIATPFEFRPFAVELQLCQRYYEMSFLYGTIPAAYITTNFIMLTTGATTIGSITAGYIYFKVTKRIDGGTVALYNPFSNVGVNTSLRVPNGATDIAISSTYALINGIFIAMNTTTIYAYHVHFTYNCEF